MATSAEQLQPGTLLNGRYEIVRPLGRGGMGTVFLAEHLQLQTTLAIKEVCSPGQSEEERQATLEQYQREARFLVQLNHPNLPKVTDAFVENERFYLVMEYIEGVTLEARLKERGGRPMPVIQVLEWGLQITDVLGYLHTQDPPIIFRDLKPSNVMLKPDNTIRLIDFGIARRFQAGAIHDTALFGSIGYSPPEQFGRQQTEPLSDIYAFGATLHQMLTGIDPAMTPFKFVSVHAVNPAVPEILSQLIQQCLAMEPEARPADIHQVAMGLVAVRETISALEPEALEEANGELTPDALHAPTVPGSPSGSPSVSTGPRIISAKLAEAEAHRRRSGSQEVGRNGSGKVTPPLPSVMPAPRSNRVPLLIMAGVLMLIALSGAAYVVSASHRKPAQTGHPAPSPLPQSPVAAPVSVTPIPPPEPDPSGGNTGGDDNHAVINNFKIVSAELRTAPDNTIWLRIVVHGEVTGVHPDPVVLWGEFTDGPHKLPARHNPSKYALDGNLIMPETPIHVMGGQFDEPLDIPMSEFETISLSQSVQFYCTAKQGGSVILTIGPYPVQSSVFKSYRSQSAPANETDTPPATQPKTNGGSSLFDGRITRPGA